MPGHQRVLNRCCPSLLDQRLPLLPLRVLSLLAQSLLFCHCLPSHYLSCYFLLLPRAGCYWPSRTARVLAWCEGSSCADREYEYGFPLYQGELTFVSTTAGGCRSTVACCKSASCHYVQLTSDATRSQGTLAHHCITRCPKSERWRQRHSAWPRRCNRMRTCPAGRRQHGEGSRLPDRSAPPFGSGVSRPHHSAAIAACTAAGPTPGEEPG